MRAILSTGMNAPEKTEIVSTDTRLLPAYTMAEAARYLRLPHHTLKYWAVGADSTSRLFDIDDPHQEYLSFMNLIEAHVISGIRRYYGVRLQEVRVALQYVREHLGTERPLIAEEFSTDGKSLFVQRFGQLINASRQGQITMRALLSARLERIDRDSLGLPSQFYPFTRASSERPEIQPKLVTINPRISFGRPSVSGVATSVLWSRYAAGDPIDYLAEDYSLSTEEVDEAIRCEAIRPAA